MKATDPWSRATRTTPVIESAIIDAPDGRVSRALGAFIASALRQLPETPGMLTVPQDGTGRPQVRPEDELLVVERETGLVGRQGHPCPMRTPPKASTGPLDRRCLIRTGAATATGRSRADVGATGHERAVTSADGHALARKSGTHPRRVRAANRGHAEGVIREPWRDRPCASVPEDVGHRSPGEALSGSPVRVPA